MTSTTAPAGGVHQDGLRPARAPHARGLARWGLPVLLLGTGILYLWNLGGIGYRNGFYAAAAQAASMDPASWLFGSLDPENTITVDKPPASLWLMGLSARLFGFSTWSMLIPQALAGVAAVWLLYAAVTRWSGPGAGLLAGTALALTPVAALMFRYNNPDALLVLLMVAAAYCVVRAVHNAAARWLALAGAAIGFAFLTKMLQAFLVLPAFALVYLVAAPTSVRTRLLHLLGAAGAVVVTAGWYIALVELWPASDRPYIGGSETDSLLELTLGHNGATRILGSGGGSPFGGGGHFGGEPGILRLFGTEFSTEFGWLLPAALIGLGAGLWFTRRAPRTDRTRAGLLLWGGWLLGGAAVLSFMAGSTHPYYTFVLAPGIAAVVGIAGRELWRGRANPPARLTLAGMVAAAGMYGFVLLGTRADWLPALRWVLLALTVPVAVAIAAGAHRFRRAGVVLGIAALVCGLGASGAYAVATVGNPQGGSQPYSGPAADGAHSARSVVRENPELADALRDTSETWAAASIGSNSASSLQLTSGKAVMPVGGFFGRDPAPTLEEFQRYVADGEIHYFVVDDAVPGPGARPGGAGQGGAAPGGQPGGTEILEWVRANFTSTTIGGQTVYDLTTPAR